MKITKSMKIAIAGVIKQAEAHRIDLKTVMGMATGAIPPVGDNQTYSCKLLNKSGKGYRVVYSIEQHPNKKWCRHLSMSTNISNVSMGPILDKVLKEFGYDKTLDNVIWFENNGTAVNVLQQIVARKKWERKKSGKKKPYLLMRRPRPETLYLK